MKPKLLLRFIVPLMILSMCIGFLETTKNDYTIWNDTSNENNMEEAKSNRQSSNDFIFFDSFSSYLFVPLVK